MIDLSTYGAISSGYAMGIGAARAASSKNAASAVSSANAYMDKLGSFNASGGLGQLKANYELAERGFNNIALSGSPKEVINARMAMDKVRKAYNKGLATEASLNRQYNALSPQARKHVDKELGGDAGGSDERCANVVQLADKQKIGVQSFLFKQFFSSKDNQYFLCSCNSNIEQVTFTFVKE